MSSPPVHDESTFRHEALFYAGEREFLAGALGSSATGWTRRADARRGRRAQDHRLRAKRSTATPTASISPTWPRWASTRPDHPRVARLRRRAPAAAAAGCAGSASRSARRAAPPSSPSATATSRCLNLAFAEDPAFWLLCPYDTEALDPAVVEEARRTHPFLVRGRPGESTPRYGGLEAIGAPFAEPLPEPARAARGAPLRGRDPREPAPLRRAPGGGRRPGRRARRDDLVLAVNEVATNSLRHGGGPRRAAGVAGCRARWSARCATAAASTRRSRAASARSPARWAATACGWPTSSVSWCRSAPSPPAASFACTCGWTWLAA